MLSKKSWSVECEVWSVEGEDSIWNPNSPTAVTGGEAVEGALKFDTKK